MKGVVALCDLISVVITYYNKFDFIKDCVNSVCNQTYQNFEIILVDDASDDGTEKICDEYARVYRNIKVIHMPVNVGLSAARVEGVKNSSGAWLFIMDGDDILADNTLEIFYKYSKKHSDVDIICGDRIESEVPLNERCTCLEKGPYKSKVWNGVDLCNNIYEKHGTDRGVICKLIRKEFLDQLDITKYQEQCPQVFFEDILYTPIMLYYCKKVAIIRRSFYVHRESKVSVSRSGKISEWSLDQISSGNILLQFYTEFLLGHAYSHMVSYYLRSILRIWCLIDGYDFPSNKVYTIKENILKNYYKYIWDYIKKGDDNVCKKMVIFAFFFSHKVWKKVIQYTYYRKQMNK